MGSLHDSQATQSRNSIWKGNCCAYLRVGHYIQIFCSNFGASLHNLAHRNRSDFRDCDAHCRPQQLQRFPRQEKAMLHCDFRVRWKVASDLRFQAAISEPKTPFFCRISGDLAPCDLAPSTRKSLAIPIVRFWCAKLHTGYVTRPGHHISMFPAIYWYSIFSRRRSSVKVFGADSRGSKRAVFCKRAVLANVPSFWESVDLLQGSFGPFRPKVGKRVWKWVPGASRHRGPGKDKNGIEKEKERKHMTPDPRPRRALIPDPRRSDPRPSLSDPKPQTPDFTTPDSKPQNTWPQTQTPDPDGRSWDPRPQTPDPDPQTPDRRPQTQWKTKRNEKEKKKAKKVWKRSRKKSQNQLFFNYFDSFSTPFSTFWAPVLRDPGTHFRTLFPTLGPKGSNDPCSGQKYSQPLPG